MPFLRKYNTLTVAGSTAIRVPMIKRGLVDFASSGDWTPVAGDVKVSYDGTVASVTNLPTPVAMGSGAYWDFVLTAAELTCKSAIVTVADSGTKAVEDQSFIVETFGHASAMYAADLSAANLPTNVVQIQSTAVDSISDGVLSRSISPSGGNVEATAGEHTLCTVILACLEFDVAGTGWVIKKSTGATHVTKYLTTSALAQPVIGIT
jgi:hypothetical protein